MRWVTGGAVLALIATLTGCSAPAPGPAMFGGDGENKVCLPIADGQQALVGEGIGAPVGAELSITSVKLADADGVGIDSTFLMQIIDGNAFGTALMPPENPPPAWEDRVDAVGATVPRGEVWNLLIVLKRGGSEPGKAHRIIVGYEVDGVAYEKMNSTAYTLQDKCF